jgi:hypothetical protein
MKVKKRNLLILKSCSFSPENCWFLPLRLKKKRSTVRFDPTFHFNADPDPPASHQSDANLRPVQGNLLSLCASIPFHFGHLKLLKFDFNSDPDPAS